MAKHQSRRVEKLTLETDPFPAICAVILLVAANRMPDRGHVCADLMGAPGLEAHS
jgi:hypothetical protein